MKLVDPHVHLRDWNQARKETLDNAFEVARLLGIGALFEMPNTEPPLTTAATILKRIAHGDRARSQARGSSRSSSGPPPFHGIYVGLTDDPHQVRAAARLRDEYFPRVVGCKLYAGHSTGRMGVVTVAAQLRVWRALAEAGYRGVVAVHAEREDLLRPDRWNRENPLTHSDARPPLAETASVQTQIALAEAAGFRGTLHICHVTTAEALEVITRERAGLPFRLTAGVTPHHLLLDTEHAAAATAPDADQHAATAAPTAPEAAPNADQHAAASDGDAPRPGFSPAPPGTGFTVNPPLRDRPARLRLWEMVLAGHADWIESDHAPHTWEEKIAGAAGLPGLPAFRRLAGELVRHLDDATVRKMTGEGVLEVFGLDPELIPHYPDVPDPPALPEQFHQIVTRYPWDPYGGITPDPGDFACSAPGVGLRSSYGQ